MLGQSVSNVIDLISEKHAELRSYLQRLDTEQLNKSETHIIAILSDGSSLSISEIGRMIGISRQGTHKSVQQLLSGGYLIQSTIENNQRDKYVTLSNQGYAYHAKQEKIKQEIETRIIEYLGKEQVEILKKLLQQDWVSKIR